MPHIIIEHSEHLPILPQVLLERVHKAAIATDLFDPATVKTRAVTYQHYQLSAGKEGFIHIQVHIMAGRTTTQKQTLSESLLACISAFCPASYCLSVHIYDLLPEIYRKN
ncbi:5-carboxymethyl-2-hydroxymuconate Delta-isomerase [Pseudoalteromonas fenneropenaei]|uniref:5-carboxymethyl-2-hydroxymuconate Delta-isomerase n=1 Tax=Pseudoalteromonas fenneropenaei TaxID=1737459 RepID=A0ABV7CKI2_9GAMM